MAIFLAMFKGVNNDLWSQPAYAATTTIYLELLLVRLKNDPFATFTYFPFSPLKLNLLWGQ